MSDWKNKLIFGDNLGIMRGFPDEYVDLIYLDPPFNSKATYNMLFQEANGSASEAQIHAFDDTWHWDMKSLETYEWLVENGTGKLPELMEAMAGFLGHNDVLAYLTMMAVRLVEMRRVLKSTGSIYLHCDPTASHYLKLVMDAVFGSRFFQSEIIWQRSLTHGGSSKYNATHDVLLFYTKESTFRWNAQRQTYDESYIESHWKNVDEDGRRYKLENMTGAGPGPARMFGDRILEPPKGRHWAWRQEEVDRQMAQGNIVFTSTGRPRHKQYLDESIGKPVTDMWTDVLPINSQARERLGYPTQKPEALLERVIKASCPDDGIVLDPFCGCGTTIAVAERLGRKWIGIDLTYIAVNLMRYRLNDTFGERLQPYEVIGIPTDSKSAEALAIEDEHSGRYQFQWWALSLVNARPVGDEKKKGADKGKDGLIRFFDDTSGKSKTIVVSVKSGNVGAKDVRDLIGAVNNSKAQMGCLVTLRPSTKAMRDAATEAGFYDQEVLGKKVQRIQILTVEGLLNETESLTYHKLQDTTFQQAPKAESEEQEEGLF